MAYTNFTNCTEQEYLDIIYSQDDKNRIRIWFNNVELSDAGEYCESLSGTNRILPSDGEKRFSLDNFIAREYDLILRDLPAGTTIADQVKISIGTLVGENTYEDVPIGIFNIQDTPVTDKNKVTIKLRDNRVKFDFGYDAKPLIDTQGGSATYKQILNDICTKAGVINDVSTFNGESIAVAIYDSTIKGSTYVAYIAEQAGAIPVITREGHLNFIYLNNLKTWRIPLSIVEKYEIGKPFEVERVVYESGIIKYQTSSDETLETLYLDAANPYVSTQAQVNSVLTIMNGFTIDSAETGKILGNPAIDAYDLIEIYDDDTDDTILTTLANNTYTFNGVHRQTFDTVIGEKERKENVTISSEATARRWAKTEIDNLNSTVTITAGKVEDLEQSIEVLKANIDTNVVIIPVNEINEPVESKTIEVGYSIDYLGTTQSNLLPTIIYPDSTHDPMYGYTGITTDLTVDKKIKFTVATGTPIQNTDNKYTFKWSKTVDSTTYEVTRTVVVSTLSTEAEQNVIMSDTAPSDTSVLWYDSVNNQLKRYDDGEWEVVNDYSSDITSLQTDYSNLNSNVQDYVKNGYDDYYLTADTTFPEDKEYYESIQGVYTIIPYTDEYELTEDTTIQADKEYYIYYNDNYELLTYNSTQQTYEFEDEDSGDGWAWAVGGNVPSSASEFAFYEHRKYYTLHDGTEYDVGDSIPANTIYEKTHYKGLQDQINTTQTTIQTKFEQTETDFAAKITTTTEYIDSNVKGKVYYTASYNLTEDTVFGEDKEYYELISAAYQPISYDATNKEYTLADSTVYEVGDTIPSNTIYVLTYNEYTGDRTGNPSTITPALYEIINGQYVHTSDETFDNGLQGQIDDIVDYVKFDAENIVTNPITGATHTGVVTIGKSNMATKLRLAADVLFFDYNDSQVAYIAADGENTKLYIKDAEVTKSINIAKSLSIGNFGWVVENDGSVTFGKVK